MKETNLQKSMINDISLSEQNYGFLKADNVTNNQSSVYWINDKNIDKA